MSIYMGLSFPIVVIRGRFFNFSTNWSLRSNVIEYKTHIRLIYLIDCFRAFDAQIYSRRKRDTNHEIYWTNYQTIHDIYGWFEYLGDNHSNIVTVVTVGQTHEGKFYFIHPPAFSFFIKCVPWVLVRGGAGKSVSGRTLGKSSNGTA